MILGRRRIPIEIVEIIATTDRCIQARIKSTGKVANFPRLITEFTPRIAWVPDWLAVRLLKEEEAVCQ